MLLSAEKVEVCKKYGGYYDGYYIQHKNEIRIVNDGEWSLLSNLIQTFF
jgi:hypothetical protein